VKLYRDVVGDLTLSSLGRWFGWVLTTAGSFDWPGMNRNVVADPAHAQLVWTLHQQVLDYIRLY
jgi:hypothetical protein